MARDNREYTNNNKYGTQNNNNGDGAQTNNTWQFRVSKKVEKLKRAAKAIVDNRKYKNDNRDGTQNNNNGDGAQANRVPRKNPHGNQNNNNGDGFHATGVPNNTTFLADVEVPGGGGSRDRADNRGYKNNNWDDIQNNNIGRGTQRNNGTYVSNSPSVERGNAAGDNRTYQNTNSRGTQNNNNGDGTQTNER
ncbi:hypothetical protein Moror_5950 [Moniliophthora roreri MCA 2997]|uniref:Uncharacterized protein n=2 Tax=Moniliophthora roreri TaxID=221103 RepID=V2WXV5_MONRO|nr:hypothetical protein Moror_5950 [Moniliophthora roreri MCA 2997]KAI3614432.1 hypothetical protein WG66_009796 [Moniliophthora roreri]